MAYAEQNTKKHQKAKHNSHVSMRFGFGGSISIFSFYLFKTSAKADRNNERVSGKWKQKQQKEKTINELLNRMRICF